MESPKQEREHGEISTRAIEIGTALAIMALGALVMYDSRRVGASWAADGPQAGYFPFYVGLLMFGASAIVLAQAVSSRRPRRNFVDLAQLKSVLALLIPTVGYVVVTFFIGIYVASAVYLAYFMRVLGNYRVVVIAPIAIGVPIFLFFLFEIWFLVPLPKGPVEALFGR